MAVYGTQKIIYTKPFNAVLDASPGLADFFIRPVIGSPSAGALSVDITTAVTLLAITDGTMAANNAASTQTALTAVIKQHCVSLLATELDQWTSERDQTELLAFINASRLALYLEVITDLVGMSAGSSATLPNGQLNFSTDGTVGEVWTSMNALDLVVSKVKGKTQGKAGGLAIITTPTGHGNLQTNANSSYALANQLKSDGELLSYRGAPIYIYDGTVSGWGAAATDVAAFVCHSGCEAFTWVEASSPHSELRFYGDGKWKKFWQCYGFGGGVQASHFGEVLNGAS